MLSIHFRWGRWSDILVQGQFKRGWQDSDVENCARIIVSTTENTLNTHLI